MKENTKHIVTRITRVLLCGIGFVVHTILSIGLATVITSHSGESVIVAAIFNFTFLIPSGYILLFFIGYGVFSLYEYIFDSYVPSLGIPHDPDIESAMLEIEQFIHDK